MPLRIRSIIKYDPPKAKAEPIKVTLRGPKGFTPEQDDFLRANWLTMRAVDIGKALGKSRESISQRVIKLDLPRKTFELRVYTS